MLHPRFDRYIGIDYSGAETSSSSLKSLCVYVADRLTTPQEVEPSSSPRKYWTRRGIAEWLVDRLSGGPPTFVGIDHGFSFPLQYFEQHGLSLGRPSTSLRWIRLIRTFRRGCDRHSSGNAEADEFKYARRGDGIVWPFVPGRCGHTFP